MTEIKDALGRSVSRRTLFKGAGLATAGVVGGSALLSACGNGSSGGPGGGSGGGGGNGGGSGAGGNVTWASWANPGEGERFKEYSKNYEKQYGGNIVWQQVVGDYQSKLLTQLAGGAAPDDFYVGDTSMAKLIESGKLVDLTSFLSSSESPTKATDTFSGLNQWCKKDDKIYGVPVDCNPKVFWFNKGMLQTAGVSTDPAAAFEAGTWNQAALDDLLTKVKATGKRGMVVEGNWFDFCSLITTFGGTAFDKDSGDCVIADDAKAKEVMAWLFDHFKAGTITYGGTLPKGQGVDALFYGQQLATIQYGRWILPNLKKLTNMQYDIAPMPSDTGKDVKPVAVYTAAMSSNVNAKNKDAALMFLSRYVSKDGQKARLSGGGNAVPSQEGLDDVVTEGNLPVHGKTFVDVARAGYAVPLKIATNADVGSNLGTTMDNIIKGGATSDVFCQKITDYINGKN